MSLILADDLGFASCFHVAEAQPWLLTCQGRFIPAAILYFFPPFQPALVSAGIPADPEMLFYLFLFCFLCVDYLQLLNCLKEPSFSC